MKTVCGRVPSLSCSPAASAPRLHSWKPWVCASVQMLGGVVGCCAFTSGAPRSIGTAASATEEIIALIFIVSLLLLSRTQLETMRPDGPVQTHRTVSPCSRRRTVRYNNRAYRPDFHDAFSLSNPYLHIVIQNEVPMKTPHGPAMGGSFMDTSWSTGQGRESSAPLRAGDALAAGPTEG
jgi:hypothetical protein